MNRKILEVVCDKLYELEKNVPFENLIFGGACSYETDGEFCCITGTEIKKGKYYRVNIDLLIPITD